MSISSNFLDKFLLAILEYSQSFLSEMFDEFFAKLAILEFPGYLARFKVFQSEELKEIVPIYFPIVVEEKWLRTSSFFLILKNFLMHINITFLHHL